MGKVGLVCDSTCDLGPEWCDANDVKMVPLKVLFGEETFRDWIDLSPKQFYDKLVTTKALPKTSQPSPLEFSEVYAELARQGCEEIVSVHLSQAISGTYESARMAAEEASVPVRIVDTKAATQATGLAVKSAVEARNSGASGEEVEARTIKVVSQTRMFFVLDTLDYLVKGGRAGKAQGLAASLLNIKPILTFTPEGVVAPFKKVKGTRKAMHEMVTQLVSDSKALGPLKVAIFQADAPDLIGEFESLVKEADFECEIEVGGWVGSVIGTYGGPNAIGCAYHPIA